MRERSCGQNLRGISVDADNLGVAVDAGVAELPPAVRSRTWRGRSSQRLDHFLDAHAHPVAREVHQLGFADGVVQEHDRCLERAGRDAELQVSTAPAREHQHCRVGSREGAHVLREGRGGYWVGEHLVTECTRVLELLRRGALSPAEAVVAWARIAEVVYVV